MTGHTSPGSGSGILSGTLLGELGAVPVCPVCHTLDSTGQLRAGLLMLAEPVHKQYVHVSGSRKWEVAILLVLYENVKDMNDLSIPIGMAPLIVVRQDHDVTSPLQLIVSCSCLRLYIV